MRIATPIALVTLLLHVARAADVQPFLATHCFECHDDDSAKADLSFESLGDLRSSHRDWVRVFDRVRGGEMPPADAKQPSAEVRTAFLETLGPELQAAALERRGSNGRAQIRRLNRVEYEATLHDLLGIAIELKSRLPEDSLVAGFDKVGRGLDLSATHLVRYQETADLALSKALPVRPERYQSQTHRMTGKAYYESRHPNSLSKVTPYVRIDDDAFVFRAQLYKHGSIHSARTPVAGRYRFRASVKAANHAGKPMPIDIGRISTDRFGHQDLEHLLGIEDAYENEWRTIEAEAMLIAGEQIYLSPRTIPHFRYAHHSKPLPADHVGPELAVRWIEIEGPLHVGTAYAAFFGNLPRVPERLLEATKTGKSTPDWRKWHANEFTKPENRLRFTSDTPKEEAARLITRFLPRALRRPPSAEVLTARIARAHSLLEDGLPLDETLLRVYKEILCSTGFLFRIEKPGKLDAYALASRLSYLLWNSLPDEPLMAAAASGEILQDQALQAQAERMLTDWRGERFARHFSGYWLDLRKFHDMKPDKLYSEYDELLAWAMPTETQLFFADILRRNRPVTEFVHSDWSYLNERLAAHYGIPGIEGMSMRRVSLPADAHRGGVITQASILKLTTNATYTSPIMRGAWVLDRIIGKPPHAPPPDVEAIEPDIRGAVTLREQMELHQSQPVCASCHKAIDPPGFALENFDVVGGWRERYRVAKGGDGIDHAVLTNHPKSQKAWLAKAVEAHGKTPDGEAFADIDAYKQILLRDPDQLARNLAEKLLIYATGATLDFADRAPIEAIVAENRAAGYGFRDLLHAVIQSPAFRSK